MDYANIILTTTYFFEWFLNHVRASWASNSMQVYEKNFIVHIPVRWVVSIRFILNNFLTFIFKFFQILCIRVTRNSTGKVYFDVQNLKKLFVKSIMERWFYIFEWVENSRLHNWSLWISKSNGLLLHAILFIMRKRSLQEITTCY